MTVRVLASSLVFGVALSACVQTALPALDRMAGVQPTLSVERFLQAANTGDLEAMARIFGTADGPIADETGNFLSCPFRRLGSWFGGGRPCVSRAEIEIRMSLIAEVLLHDDYRVRSEAPVPGRSNRTTRIGVDLVRGASRYADVPFEVVQTPDGRWLVESVGLDRITA